MNAPKISLLAFCFVAACGSADDKGPPLPWIPSRVDWRFDRPADRLDAEVDIVSDPGERVGMYVVVFRGKIGTVPFYFGVQTNVWQPDVGWIGKGIIYSRWQSSDLADARIAPGGFARGVRGDDPYVGVRMRWAWTPGRYAMTLAREDEDWYALSIRSLDRDEPELPLGALRFPPGAMIQRDGSSSTMVYLGAKTPSDVPAWDVHVAFTGAPVGTPSYPAIGAPLPATIGLEAGRARLLFGGR